ncbi:hypothetical protein [Butyrivibrio sp. FCS014]|uniref:hypothetical protein n=1 Tax=Butyrivibrio sp. FCS014 TaxID=1408304 RepID=UPI00046492E4|nr:hypothetical protein [Butyrivibrio sp. FCS014]
MRIKNSLSPYPILNDYGDDYTESSFTVDYDVKTQFSEICGDLSFKLNNKGIKKLIEDRKAQYVAHIECPLTCYRMAKKTYEPYLSFSIDSAEVSKVIEIRTFIVLLEDIEDFSSERFHPDYAGQSFNLSSHQIIAVGTAKDFKIKNDDRNLDSLPSIITIEKLSDDKRGSIAVNTDNDEHIIIGLTEEVYEQYRNLGRNRFKSTAFSLVLLPALLIVLQRMHQGKDDDEFSSKHWFQVIKNLLEKNDCKLENISAEDDSLLKVCQKIFSDPIARSFKELKDRSERME